MNLKELRIGNYICSKEDDNKIVIERIIAFENLNGVYVIGDFDKVQEKLENNTYINVSAILPIKITEELLLRFGAEKQLYENDENDYYLIIRHERFNIIYENEDCIFCEICDETFMLKYIHQLQNLYFTLTGKELI